MKYLKVLLLIAAIAFFVVACGDDDPLEQCSNAMDCSGTPMQACCNPSQCRYVIGDQQFPCDGTDCSSAANDAVAYCNTL